MDGRQFRDAMSQFATGITLVTGAADDGSPVGFTANSVTSVSLDPPLLLVCADRGSASLPTLLATGRFAVSVLGSGHGSLARRFAEEVLDERFRDAEHLEPSPGGLPVLADALAWMECRVWRSVDGGDHVILIGEVLGCGSRAHGDPLVFFRGGFNTVRGAS